MRIKAFKHIEHINGSEDDILIKEKFYPNNKSFSENVENLTDFNNELRIAGHNKGAVSIYMCFMLGSYIKR